MDGYVTARIAVLTELNFCSNFSANGASLNNHVNLSEKDLALLREKKLTLVDPLIPPLTTGMALRKNQFYAMFIKYGLYYLRHYYLTTMNLLAPILVLLLILITVNMIKERMFDRKLRILLSKMDTDTLNLVETHDPVSEFALLYMDIVRKQGDEHNITFIRDDMSTYVFQTAKKQFIFYSRHMPLAVSVLPNNKCIAWFNGQFLHSMPMSLQLVYDTVLRSLDLKIRVANNPIPLQSKEVRIGFDIHFDLLYIVQSM